MKRAIVLPEVCKNCDICSVIEKCVNMALIRESAEDRPWIDFYKCRGCMKCVSYCQNNAVGEITHPCSGAPSKGW